MSFNEKVRRKRRACQIKDRRQLTALTGIYNKNEKEAAQMVGGGVGMRVEVVEVVLVREGTVENCVL